MWLTLIAIVVVVIVVAFFTLNKEEPFSSSSIDDRDRTPYIEQYRYIPNFTSSS